MFIVNGQLKAQTACLNCSTRRAVRGQELQVVILFRDLLMVMFYDSLYWRFSIACSDEEVFPMKTIND